MLIRCKFLTFLVNCDSSLSGPCLIFCVVLTVFHDNVSGWITFSGKVLFTIRHISPVVRFLALLDGSTFLLPVIMQYFHLCTCCIWGKELVMLNWPYIQKNIFQKSCSFFNILPEVLLHCYQCIVYVLHVVYYYPASLHHSDNVGLPMVISVICLFHYDMCPWSTISTLDTYLLVNHIHPK